MEAGQRPAIDFGNLDLEEIDALLDTLESEEHDLSAKRRRAHERIDHVRADVRSVVESHGVLVRLQAWERRLSGKLRALHGCSSSPHEARAPVALPAIDAKSLIGTLDMDVTNAGGKISGKTPYPYPTARDGAVEMISELSGSGERM